MSGMGFMKGICIGMAVGAAAGMVAVSQNRKYRKFTKKAVRTIGNTAHGIAGTFSM